MKRTRLLTLLLVGAAVFFMLDGVGMVADWAGSYAAEQDIDDGSDPDLPAKFHGPIDEATYLRMRDEYVALRRGIEPGHPLDPQARGRAIDQMQRQENKRLLESLANTESSAPITPEVAWTPIGPAPLPNGTGNAPVSGRVTAIVVDPTNPNKVYLGAAQGGVWRSLDAGASWTPIFDNSQSLAIGALALAPSSPTTLYVGTGEFNACSDCFFGAGLYRIDNADTSATLVGPINPTQTIGNLTYPIFNGRSISKILVHPTDAATIFVATARGASGSGGNGLGLVPTIATRGVYRSTNATSAAGSVTFQKLIVTTDNSPDSPATGNEDIADMVMDPGNPDNIIVAAIGPSGSPLLSGIYWTTSALGAASFSQVLSLPTNTRVTLAINKVGSVVTAYAATSETPTATTGCISANSGAVRKVTDPFGGGAWSGQLTGGGGFCSGQCFYDMPIAVDPGNANTVYIGGQTSGTCGGVVRKSTDGGNSFANDSTGLHVDDHALFFDGAGNIYTGNDGGVWKKSTSLAPGTAWTNLNNAPLNTLQFESVSVHPIDQFLTIGGTQDNGTEYQLLSSGNWHNAEGGDGGYTLIDQSATDATNVTMYLTFFNQPNIQILFDRATLTSCLNVKDSWPTRGTFACGSPLAPCPDNNTPASQCDNLPFFKNNGIQISDNVLFYAPMALGPGTPNTMYFGTDRLYGSTDRGDNMMIVSQSPILPTGTRCPVGQTCPPSTPASVGTPISTIAVSPQDDNYRIVGMQNGQVFATSTGSATLVDITSASFPGNPANPTNIPPVNKFVGRAIIDPSNKNVAYVAFSYYAAAGQGVWKITNLGAAAGSSPVAPNWTAAGNGIPSVPINAFAVDLLNSNNLFAGTDIGVYNSTDGGANWAPFGTGLPRVAVFDLKIQNGSRILRVATHGRGMWEIPLAPPASLIQFSPASYIVNEASPRVDIFVSRTGDTTGAASVNFTTNDAAGLQNCDVINHIASPRCDYINTLGTLQFAPGETSKTFSVAIVDDSYSEGPETFTLTLTGSSGAGLGLQSNATVTITDNEATTGPNNPIDDTNFFVRQQYIDFLGREPDPPGFAAWVNEINTCSGDTTLCDRIHVSQLFFQSAEFQQRGYYVYRFYPVSFGRKPFYAEFVPDLASVSGFLSDAQLEAAKAQFAVDFTARPAFASAYNGLNNTQYVDTLLSTAGVSSTFSAATRQSLIDGLNNSTLTRAQVLRQIVESTDVSNKYFNQAYAVMEYFGYLRREPDAAYLDWIHSLDTGTDPRTMVIGFVNSIEYRQRFGP